MINRRTFLKLAGAGLLSLLLPIRIKEQMELSDVWAKLANQARLTPEELDFLKMQGRETQQRNAFVAGNTTPQGTLAQDLPFFPIFSETFEANKTELIVQIPSGYRHLMFFASVQNTSATTPSSLRAQLNGDTGTNYNYQYTVFSDIAPVSTSTPSDDFMFLGYTHSSEVGATSSIFGVMNNYGDVGRKMYTGTSGVYVPTSSLQTSLIATSSWNTTDPIKSIRFISNAVAGSVITIYGIR